MLFSPIESKIRKPERPLKQISIYHEVAVQRIRQKQSTAPVERGIGNRAIVLLNRIIHTRSLVYFCSYL